jgi:hypothetical protein
MKKYVVILLLLSSQLIQAQTAEKPSMLEYLSNVVMFNPSFVQIHETEDKMTHDIMVTGHWKYEIEFKNRKQQAIYSVLNDEKKVLFEISEEADKAATVIDLASLAPGIYYIQKKAATKQFIFEVHKLMGK